jgi:hypothetical protein
MKYRKGKVKSQHGMIKGLREFLNAHVAGLDFVEGVIPGEIKVGSGTGETLAVRFQYSTISGAKLIARSGASIQEIFVVTKEPERLRKIIEEVG